jgi:hypothetical protein
VTFRTTARSGVAILLAACVLGGCQPAKVVPAPGNAAKDLIRGNCYSLLYQLLEEQKDVSILRFIKREHAEVKKLVKTIADDSASGSKLLREYAKLDATIKLDDFGLPPGEVATRASIASAKRKELLSQSGDEFELTLLLTQTEALGYASHLAKVAGENESQPARAQAMAGLSEDMESLYRRVFAMLRSKAR